MPRIYKSGKEFKGNKNSGDKPDSVKLLRKVEEIVKKTIEELAKDKVYGHLEIIEEKTDRQGVKEIALPVYLKSQVDKKEVTGNLTLKFDKNLEDVIT